MSQRFKPFATVALIVEHNGKYLIVEEYNEDQDNRLVLAIPAVILMRVKLFLKQLFVKVMRKQVVM